MEANRNNNANARRLHELENEFLSLEPQIQDPAVKGAISILHGMLQESRRNIHTSLNEAKNTTVQDIANLYRRAPKMEAPARNVPIEPGVPAPDFKLPDAEGRLVSLSDFRGRHVLLVFYPLDWSPGCSQQLDLYQQEIQEFEKRGIAIIGISVDSIYSHGAWAAVREITFPLLADFNPKGEVARKYQVYRNEDGFTERALYLIDEGGMIQYSYLSPFLHHVPDIYELFNRLDELKEVKNSHAL